MMGEKQKKRFLLNKHNAKNLAHSQRSVLCNYNVKEEEEEKTEEEEGEMKMRQKQQNHPLSFGNILLSFEKKI